MNTFLLILYVVLSTAYAFLIFKTVKKQLQVDVEDANVWVDDLHVHIMRTDEGVVVDIFGKDGELLAGTYAFFQVSDVREST